MRCVFISFCARITAWKIMCKFAIAFPRDKSCFLFKVLFVSFHDQPIYAFTGHVCQRIAEPNIRLGRILRLHCISADLTRIFHPRKSGYIVKTVSDNKSLAVTRWCIRYKKKNLNGSEILATDNESSRSKNSMRNLYVISQIWLEINWKRHKCLQSDKALNGVTEKHISSTLCH